MQTQTNTSELSQCSREGIKKPHNPSVGNRFYMPQGSLQLLAGVIRLQHYRTISEYHVSVIYMFCFSFFGLYLSLSVCRCVTSLFKYVKRDTKWPLENVSAHRLLEIL